MFEKITAEQAGISSAKIEKIFRRLESKGLNFHGAMMLRGGKVFFETYFAPFNAQKPHRIYSITKSFVAVAVGVLVGNGEVSLDDPIIKYFPEYDNDSTAENLRKQTIRDMLTMTTSATPGYWFADKPDDRVQHYFSSKAPRLAGAWFDYDSEGSFILGAMIERVSGMPLLDFFKEYFLDEIGFSSSAKMLSCPGGHTWGDSAMICTLRDLALFAQLVTNKGQWNGKQLIDKDYMTDAVSILSTPELNDNNIRDIGYGYQIWIPREGMFSFNGMGGQFAICAPEKDFIFVCNADSQCDAVAAYAALLFSAVIDDVVDCLSDTPLPENTAAADSLQNYADTRKLRTAIGEESSPLMAEILGQKYICEPNDMGWKWFVINQKGDDYEITYENTQGEKTIGFGMKKNVFGKFPQAGYSDFVGTKKGADGMFYDCAASAAWRVPNKLGIFVQIIDDYFGRLSMNFCFTKTGVGMRFTKQAEDFLLEYGGTAVAYKK